MVHWCSNYPQLAVFYRSGQRRRVWDGGSGREEMRHSLGNDISENDWVEL